MTVRAAAPVPAPRSTNVNGSSTPNGNNSAINPRCAPRRRSRSSAVDLQKVTPISLFQIASLVSWSVGEAADPRPWVCSCAGMQAMLCRGRPLGNGRLARVLRWLNGFQVRAHPRHRHASPRQAAPLATGLLQRGQPRGVPRGGISAGRSPYLRADPADGLPDCRPEPEAGTAKGAAHPHQARPYPASAVEGYDHEDEHAGDHRGDEQDQPPEPAEHG